jgi:hypothetical protein
MTETNFVDKDISLHSRPRYWINLWEDQHPLARSNFLLLGLLLLSSIVLWLMLMVAPRMFDLHIVFQLAVIERLWFLANVVLLAIFVYSIIRLMWMATHKDISYVSLLMVWITPFVLMIPLILMPTFFQAMSSYQMGRSYREISQQFSALCDDWQASYGQQASIALRVDDVDLGLFQDNDRVNVWRESNTIFFDFGDETQSFGLACALGGREPYDSGQRSRSFYYRHIQKHYYEFYEDSSKSSR